MYGRLRLIVPVGSYFYLLNRLLFKISFLAELIDFWRFNAEYAAQIYAEQPLKNAPGIWNRVEYRPLVRWICKILDKLKHLVRMDLWRLFRPLILLQSVEICVRHRL